MNDYDLSVFYHPNKANVVANTLSRMTICSVSHIEESKIDLVKDVHRFTRLGVKLEDSLNSGFMVYHNSESSLEVDEKSKKHLDKLIMELHEFVLGKHNDSFSLGGMMS